MAKNLIWCEVTCGKCGAAANGCGYYSPERIKKLKLNTKNWVEDDCYRVLCPECAEEVEKIRNLVRGASTSSAKSYIDKEREKIEFFEDSFF